jgi:putative NADH-flavin reductase
MRLALLGGTGRIGQHLLAQALESGHEVTALAREPAALRGQPGLTVVPGDATDAAAVSAVVRGADAVLSALGPRGARTQGMLGTASRNLVAAMSTGGARRLICVSAAGAFISGDPDLTAMIKLILPRVLAKQFADVRDMESAIRASGLEWTLVRATQLTSGPLTGRYRVRPDYSPAGGRKISRADVAHFIGAVLDDDSWVKSAPALAY